MNRATLEWYELLARSLMWIAGIVLLLSAVAAVVVAGSDNTVPVVQDIVQQSRGLAALAALGGGLAAAGLLAGIGAILRLMVVERLEKLAPEPAKGDDEPAPEQLALSETRRRERTETRRRERQ